MKSMGARGRGRGLVGRGSKVRWHAWQVPGYMRGGEGLDWSLSRVCLDLNSYCSSSRSWQ